MIVRFMEFDGTPLETLHVTARTADNRGAWLAVDATTALFVPWNVDWCVRFYSGDEGGLELFAQAVKPVRISPDLIELVGLDLGIEVVEGSVKLTGEDEFDWNQVAQEYPEDLIRRARAGVNDALERIMLASYPFDRTSSELVGEFGA